jgi:hypothetical protein
MHPVSSDFLLTADRFFSTAVRFLPPVCDHLPSSDQAFGSALGVLPSCVQNDSPFRLYRQK